mgnify:CR=1 FL=1
MKKIIKTLVVVLVVVLAIAAFTACGPTPEPTTPAACEHTGGAATCTEAAVCELCGESYGKALGHKEAFTTPIQPTCTEEGISGSSYCSVCGEVFIEAIVIPANGHVMEEVAAKDPTCTADGYTAHNKCEVCGFVEGKETIEAIPHTLVDVEGKDATCLEAGYTAHKACECGYTEGKEEIEILLTHNYVNGICSVCEAQDPEYVDYYLVGYINGADYGCEGDHANLGEYKFVDGKLVVTFTQDSYVFVKSGNLKGESVKWYLFETYTTGKEGTLIENKSEKMFVPGNVEVTFTLTVNEDGTLTLAMDYHTHVFGEATCTSPAKCECGETQGEALGHADENGDFKCDRCSTKMLPADGTALTIPQALAIAKMQSHNTYTTQKYYITGIVTNLYNTQYGNFYIKDADGNEICIYGLYSADGKTRYDAMGYKPVEGDEVTVYTVLGAYNTTYQGKNAWLDEVVAHDHDYKAVVTEPTCTKGGYTTHTCSICNGYYVDTETEALGHTTENGVCERCELTIGGDVVNKETFKADFDTVTSTNSSYVSSTTKSGWKATNSAVMGGGTTDANPKFKVFGEASTRAFTLNGKTSAKGKLVSPTLADGLSLLSFNYTNCFSESNGVDITITIIQNGETVATKRLDNNSVTKLTAYTFTWDLEAEGIAVTGDFTIEITNNSPSNNTGNKDRVSIWNLEWTNNPAA